MLRGLGLFKDYDDFGIMMGLIYSVHASTIPLTNKPSGVRQSKLNNKVGCIRVPCKLAS
jgi:hypothetical protein